MKFILISEEETTDIKEWLRDAIAELQSGRIDLGLKLLFELQEEIELSWTPEAHDANLPHDL